ncbi:MAG: hypothetical protein JXA57_01105 [Armatimonadetes bacterium]|nr:hypothetical protein [Armatimonadota bacterium]
MRGVGYLLRKAGKVSGVCVALVYVGLGLADMFFSLTAFVNGVPEANPVMAWLLAKGLFIPGKLLLTGLVAALIAASYRMEQARPVAWAALGVTAAVNLYHVWGLSVV